VNTRNKAKLPIVPNDDSFGVFDAYLDMFDGSIPPSELINVFDESEGLKYDLYKETDRFISDSLFISEAGAIGDTTTIGIEKTFEIGSNNLELFETDTTENYSIPIEDTNLISIGATAGTTLEDSDVVWQIVDDNIEGAWLKRGSGVIMNDTARFNLWNGYSEFRFPYPNRGLSGYGLEWTGKGVDDVTEVGYISHDDQINQHLVENAYWADETELSACESISLYRTTLIDDGAFPHKNSTMADNILMKAQRDDTDISGESAWLFDFDNTELPIACGENDIYYPLFRNDSNGVPDFPFTITDDQCENKNLVDINMSDSMCGAIGGVTMDTSDIILRVNKHGDVATEGAWLRSVEVDTADVFGITPYVVEGLPMSTGINVVAPAGKHTPFVWMFEDTPATEVINGYDHDDNCEYHNISNFSSVINPEPTKDTVGWSQCDCRAVFYSPAGNPKESFETYRDYYDIIYEDSATNADFSFTNWVDSEGDGFRDSNNFGVFFYSGAEPDVGFGVGVWECPNGNAFKLKKGRAYKYKRMKVPDGGSNGPCFVINNCKCNIGCGSAIWTRMFRDDDGDWVTDNQISDMVMESGYHYKYIKRADVSYTLRDKDSDPNILENYKHRSTPAPNFIINIPLYDTRPFWAETKKVYGLDVGVIPEPFGDYLLTTQPTPSGMVLYDDVYVRFNRNGCKPMQWHQDMVFEINTGEPSSWRKIEFMEFSPILLQKIIGCGACELVFDTDPNMCAIRHTNCNSYFTKMTATDKASDLIIRSPENCKGTTELIYTAQNSFSWNEEVTVTIDALELDDLEGYATPDKPWRNLLHGGVPQINIDERGNTLLTDGEIGVFTPFNLGVTRTVCFDITNIMKNV